jgi:predicted DNA-binding transcriptional regulator YafY
VAVEQVLVDHTDIKPGSFRYIHRAMAAGTGISVAYMSMSTPQPHQRVIYPHALVQAGARWHVRAWCTKVEAFRDFNLSRIEKAVPVSEPTLVTASDDTDWQTQVDVHLEPHMALSPQQARVVRDEYMRGTTALVLRKRIALIPYVLHIYNASIDPERQCPPQYLLQVRNAKELPPQALWQPS